MNHELNSMDRRGMLRIAAALGGAGMCSASSPSRVLGGAPGEGSGTLVLVQLAGGNDGLSTVVPHGDDAYHAARPRLGHAAADVLRIDEYRGLHPSLTRMHGLYHEGRLGIVEGVGYPQPNRSHFKSLEVWHTADARGRSAGEGWVGRLVEAAYRDDVDSNRVVHIGTSAPYSLFSTKHAPAAFSIPAAYRWVKGGAELDDINRPATDSAPAKSNLEFLRKRMNSARDSASRLRSVVLNYRTKAAYPRDAFAGSLRSAAALIDSDLETKVVSVELGGFDTHNNQLQRHARQMRILDGALGAFQEDLGRSARGRRAVVLVYSEFGRRVTENGSRGTDHGCAGPMFALGSRVQGGLHGKHPSLTDLDTGDLVFNVDFRSVYAAAIEATFDVPARSVLGLSYPRLRLFTRGA